MLFNANCQLQRCVEAVETAQGPPQAATARSVVYLVSLPRPHSLSRRQPVTDMHTCTLHRCLPVFRQIEQPSEEDAASLTAALLAVEGAVLAEEVLASRLAARRTRFHSGAQLLQVRAILVLS